MKVIIGIYKITSPSGKIYIGQSINVEKRFKRYNKLDCKGQPRLYKSFLKYGVETHKIEIILECSVEELNEKERYFQDLYSVIGNNGLNCILTKTNTHRRVFNKETIIKQSMSKMGGKQSKETILKRVISNTGLKRSQEIKDKMTISASNRVGIPLTENHKNKISESNKGKVFSQETRKKLSIAITGKIRSEETKFKLSIIGKNMSEYQKNKLREFNLEKKHSQETKIKMSKSHKGKIFSEEQKYNMRLNFAKKVYCLKENKIYESIADCAKKNNFKHSTLNCKLNGQNPNNTSFVYYNELIHNIL